MLKIDDNSLNFYKKSSENGNPYASLVLAKTIFNKEELNKENFQATDDYINLLKKSLPLPEANYLMYLTTKDFKFLLEAAQANYPDALYPAAIELFNQQTDIGKAIEYMKLCISAGNKDAASYLIRYYIERKEFNTSRDIFATIEFEFNDTLKKLSGILDVCRGRYDSRNIQYLHDHPEDVECKYYSAIQTLFTGSEEALSTFENNTEDIIGYKNIGMNACLMIARAFKNGKGVKLNLVNASVWYEKALTKGFNDYIEVSDCYQEIDQPQKVFDCLNKAAENGDRNGMVRLGKLLLEKNNEVDHEMALVWFEQAAELGSEEAKEIMKKLNNQ